MPSSGGASGAHVDGNENSYLDWQIASQSVSGNYSMVNWQIGWRFDAYSCRGLRNGSGVINGTTVYHDFDSGDGVHAFNASHDHRAGVGKFQTASGTIKINHNSDGTKSFSVTFGMTGFSGATSNGSGTFTLTAIPRMPGVTSTPVLSEIEQTSVKVSWTPNASDGLPYTGYTIGYGTSPTAPTSTVTGTVFPRVVSGLSPGLKYYFWVKMSNSAGTGPYSAPANATLIAGASVNVAGIWKRAVPYVRVAGVWKVARPWVKIVGEWKETI